MIPLLLLTSTYLASSLAQSTLFSPCPLLGPRFPVPKTTAASPIIQDGGRNLTNALDTYIASGNGDFGPITPNTTSFSIALFSTETTNSSKSFFYEYHHSAASLTNNTSQGVKEVDADSVYRVGDLTSLFTTWLFLVEVGETYWDEPVSKWVPELASNNSAHAMGRVSWCDITLGDLAAHLGGVGKYTSASELDANITSLLDHLQIENGTTASPCETGSAKCHRAEFLSYFAEHPPVFAPATTPIFSNAGFIILAYALETIKGKPFADLIQQSILDPLQLSSTALLYNPSNHSVVPSTLPETKWSDPVAIEAPFNGLYSSLSDISTALQAILSSKLLDQPVTRRWLKPVSHTSNRANSIGRPWEIYSLTTDGPSPVVPVHQVRGNVGLYSSHIGLVPDYNVGFVILAADNEANPDLNAYADIISVALIPALEENAIAQASRAFAGTYGLTSQATLSIAPATDSTPGLALTQLKSHGKDIRAIYANLNRVEPENLSFRLYPTDITERTTTGEKMVFRAVFQDMTELADAGTPTCETWRYIDGLQINGFGLDEFIFEVNGNGYATTVEVPALGLKLKKE